ncbi:MAG TPA: GAF domain-containing protein [Candidatus Limnocylindria bacterium]|nr:GAF domain-containing protein [Candidatus Limnocylindria bacterium]
MPDADPHALLSVAQAAALLGVHPNTIRTWTDAGRLTAYRINVRGDRRYRRGDVMRLLVEDGAAMPSPETPGERAPTDGHAPDLTIFSRIASGLAITPTIGSVARTLVEALRTELRADRVAVYAVVDGEPALTAHAGFDTAPSATLPLDAVPGDDDDVHLPLATRRGTTGLLVMDRRTADAMAPAFRESLSAIAGTALAAARVIGRARRDLSRTRALSAVTRELAGELDLTRVLDDIIERTRTLFGADRAGLWQFDGEHHPVALVTRGLSAEFLARSESLTARSETISVRAHRESKAAWRRNAHLDDSIGEMRQAYADEGIRTVCIVPLRSAGDSIGVLGLYHDTDRSWPHEEIALVQAFADQAAIAIGNARLYRSVAEQAARIRSIQDLSARLNRLTEVRAIGQAIVDEASALADYHDIRIYRVDWERRVCEPIAFTREMLGDDAEDAETLLRVEIGEGFTGYAAEHGEAMLINNALDDDRGKTIDGTDDVPESMLVVPMLYEGRALGVIVLSQLGFDRFTNDDLQTMTIFAGYAAQAMANAATYEQLVAQSTELERRADSQRRLLEVSERLMSTLDQAGVLELIADGLRDVVAYDNLSIYRADHPSGAMIPVLTRERHADEVSRYIIPFGRGLMGWAVEHAEPILANDALDDPRALQIPGTPEDPEAVVVVPLIADGEVLGALNVSRVGGPEVFFSPSDFELVQLFAAQASIALSNADAHHAVSQRAETDALTGLGNHGAFQRDLGNLIEATAAAARAADRRLVLLMMDLDRFKAYNDRHGHPAGDALLHRIATAIYGAARSDDRVYRYGGDEFALLLPGTTTAEGVRVAQRIRRAVARVTATEPSPVTITVGVAAMPADATDRASLIAAADSSLYYGKRSGEDRVVRADRLPVEVDNLRGTLEELATTALRDEDVRAVEHLVERASRLGDDAHDHGESLRDALLAVSRSFDTRGAQQRGHSDRVGRLCAGIGAALGLPETEQHDLELAGRLHSLQPTDLAELSRVPSLQSVAALISGYRRLVAEGSARPRRVSRPHGSVACHVIGVANAYDHSVTGDAGQRVGRAEALASLRRDPATWRSEVIDALASAVSQRQDAGRRRRGNDVAIQEAHGAA